MGSGKPKKRSSASKNSKLSFIQDFLQKESAGGLLLMGAAALALIIANSGLEPYYQLLLSTPMKVSIGTLKVGKPLLLWINDGLMAVFFFLVGMELKRELVEGELSDRKKIILPAAGAIGGMILPVVIFILVNLNYPEGQQGWAIPAATDIAFALGILSLLGKRVPVSIKIFLTSLAIFDDIGAVLIIAFFLYVQDLAYGAGSSRSLHSSFMVSQPEKCHFQKSIHPYWGHHVGRHTEIRGSCYTSRRSPRHVYSDALKSGS